jgi:hypothetical protein
VKDHPHGRGRPFAEAGRLMATVYRTHVARAIERRVQGGSHYEVGWQTVGRRLTGHHTIGTWPTQAEAIAVTAVVAQLGEA